MKIFIEMNGNKANLANFFSEEIAEHELEHDQDIVISEGLALRGVAKILNLLCSARTSSLHSCLFLCEPHLISPQLVPLEWHIK